jgi:metal-sulfur cluster biosynthetic enzyme
LLEFGIAVSTTCDELSVLKAQRVISPRATPSGCTKALTISFDCGVRTFAVSRDAVYLASDEFLASDDALFTTCPQLCRMKCDDMQRMTREEEIAEVWRALEAVRDPELDESLTRLGFVRAVDIDGAARVRISIRLPTYWCAANFAFIMAEDARAALESLPWVREAIVTIEDHYSGDEINRGIAAKLQFSAAFPGEADDNLTDLRRLFRAKAFMRRQEKLLRRMLADGHTAASLAALTLDRLQAAESRNPDEQQLKTDYIAIRVEFARGSDLAFVTMAGAALDPKTFRAYMAELRRTTANIEFNAAICTGLLQARIGEPPK